jgi:hypothetical protein
MALFLTRLAESAGITLEAAPPAVFLDVTDLPHSTQLAINQRAEAGVAKGTTATTFSPDAEVLRRQMALVLTRTLRAGAVEPQ